MLQLIYAHFFVLFCWFVFYVFIPFRQASKNHEVFSFLTRSVALKLPYATAYLCSFFCSFLLVCFLRLYSLSSSQQKSRGFLLLLKKCCAKATLCYSLSMLIFLFFFAGLFSTSLFPSVKPAKITRFSQSSQEVLR